MVVMIGTLLLMPPGPAAADVLILKDGRRFEGMLQNSNDKTVTFEIVGPAGKLVMTFPKGEVSQYLEGPISTTASAPATPQSLPSVDCFVVPIHGVFGLEVTNAYLSKCLNTATINKVGSVVFDVDSPGGLVAEMDAMLATMDSHKALRMIAYVRKAGSAAAIFSMGCKEIVMHPKAAIGAAVVIRPGMVQLPPNVAAKLESYDVAKCKAVAEATGHEPLLVEGMMRLPIVLSVVERDGKPKVVEGTNGRVIKRAGEILTLTAKDAVACGLAIGTAESVEAIPKIFGKPEWVPFDQVPIGLRNAWVKELEVVIRQCVAAENKANDYVIELSRVHDIQEKIKLLKEVEKELTVAAARALKYPGLVWAGYIRSYEDLMEVIDAAKRERKRLEGLPSLPPIILYPSE